ncbi:MAG: radical SAM protein [Candidatus Coatesbacteria bacterium]|nr:MAG: radical SAM protein [Candidatus Coatesbacteria bacterium]
MLLELKDGIIYGPINSRRLGKSLGINLMPGRFKLCSFDCVYCHFGRTDELSVDMREYVNDLPDSDEVVRAVEGALKSSLEFGYVTFSGNGEPTLHPDFPELVDEVVELRDTYRPDAKVALLSNSTALARTGVREAVRKIDAPVFKLDAGTERTFRAINRPARRVDFYDIVERLSSLDGIRVQSVLVDGAPSNISAGELESYFDLVSLIQPVEVHIYSIDRPVPDTGISLVPPERLEDIARAGREATGVPFVAFYK